MLYEAALRRLLFRLDPEKAHETAARLLELSGRLPGGRSLLGLAAGAGAPDLETTFLGIKFPNPVGLAAGFDKDCRLAPVLPALGFGFIEVGSVTLRPQPGNDRPRLFRLPEYKAIINRMGFNSDGADAAARRLEAMGRLPIPLGINVGLNKDCPPEKAPAEYAECFRRLAAFGDYFVVNVSSPNTPGLRALQDRLRLERILEDISAANPRRKPVLVKIDPDHPEEELALLLEVVGRLASGVVASNTTVSREGLPGDLPEMRGGLSGAPLRCRATALVAAVRRLTGGRLPIIGVGGIFTGGDALEKIRAGAGLVQIYTGLIYRGPSTARQIQRELAEALARGGFTGVAAAVATA